MALSKLNALDAVKTVLENQRLQEMPRLERIHNALDVDPANRLRATVQIPDDAPPLMREIACVSETNLLPLLVKTFSQVMKVDGITTVVPEGETDPWSWWQRNRMDSRQTGLTRSALGYGAAYGIALPGVDARGRKGPAISLYSPRQLTALYQDPEADEWPMLAVAIDDQDTRAGNTKQIISLFDEELRYTFEVDSNVGPRFFEPGAITFGAGKISYISAEAHGLGVTPVVRYRDRNLLAGEEQYGIVEPLMRVQERINETTFEMQVAAYFQAFKQRYVLGWIPDGEDEELKAGAARIWYLDENPEDVKIGELDGGVVDTKLREAAIRDFASIGQVPAQALGVDGISNISDATLAGLEAAKNREAGEIMTSLGESHEQLFRLCALIDGNEAAADDYNSEVRWRNFEARSFGQTAAALSALATGLGLPAEALVEDVPGFTGQRLEKVLELLKAKRDAETAAAVTPAK